MPPAARQEPPPRPPVASSPPSPLGGGSGSTLEAFLAHACVPADRISLALVVILHGALVLRGGLLPVEEALFAGTAIAHLAALGASLVLPPRRWRAVRLPVLAALRAADCVAINAAVDSVRVIAREHAAADEAGIAGSFEELLRAVMLLGVAVCSLQSLAAGAIGFVLPPTLHLALQTAAVAAAASRTPSGGCHLPACLRGPCIHSTPPSTPRFTLDPPVLPAACRVFVHGHSHRRLIRWAYTACRHVAATVLLGSSHAFALAAEESTDAEKCRAVAWTLQVCLCLSQAGGRHAVRRLRSAALMPCAEPNWRAHVCLPAPFLARSSRSASCCPRC